MARKEAQIQAGIVAEQVEWIEAHLIQAWKATVCEVSQLKLYPTARLDLSFGRNPNCTTPRGQRYQAVQVEVLVHLYSGNQMMIPLLPDVSSSRGIDLAVRVANDLMSSCASASL